MSHFENQGIRFHYELVGEGFPLILNHGLGGDLEHPKGIFGGVQGFQTLYWDCRGHGQTEPVGPPEGFSFARFAEDLNDLVSHLGIDQAVVGGISMGAALSTRFALNHPEKVRALLLIRPAWLDRPNPPPLEMAKMAANLLETKGVQGALEDEKTFCGIPESFHCAFRDQITKPLAYERRFRLERMPASSPISDWSEVERIECPTLVIGNDQDPVHPLEYARTWVEKLPTSRFAQVTSKLVDLELHEREVREAVVGFLDGLSLAED
jgi:pimeloyl-ACP methyl ester carboxylesterase